MSVLGRWSAWRCCGHHPHPCYVDGVQRGYGALCSVSLSLPSCKKQGRDCVASRP